MKALVLTYDHNHPYAAHMISSYERAWPDHPFVFLVPYQETIHPCFSRLRSKIEFVEAPQDIKGTIQALLGTAEPNEWIYWAIDDKYVVKLEAGVAQDCHAFVQSCADLSVAGISIGRARRLSRPENVREDDTLRFAGETYLRRVNYDQIWLHQFLRAKVLATLFDNFPESAFAAKAMDELKDGASLPDAQRLYVIKNNAIVFGESMTRGCMTANCDRDMSFDLRAYTRSHTTVPTEIYIGKLKRGHVVRRWLGRALRPRGMRGG